MDDMIIIGLTDTDISLVAFSLGCYLGTLSREGKLTDRAHQAVVDVMDKINRAREEFRS